MSRIVNRRRALLINAGGGDNLGDYAIRYVLERILADHGFAVDFAGLTGTPRHGQAQARDRLLQAPAGLASQIRTKVPIAIRVALRNSGQYRRILRGQYDLALIGGGQLALQNRAFAWAIYQWVRILQLSRRTRIVVFGVGADTHLHGLERCLYKWALRKVDAVWVRDPQSQVVLQSLGVSDCRITHDVVYCLPDYMPLNEDPKRRVAVSVVSFRSIQKYQPEVSRAAYTDYWVATIRKWHQKGYEVVLFNTTKDDLAEAECVQRIVREQLGFNVTMYKIENLKQLVEVIASSELIVSGRMHALIIAQAYGRKVVPYKRNAKLSAFAKNYIEQGDLDVLDIRRKIVVDLERALEGLLPL